MIARFERFVALRYLWNAEGRKEGRKFLRVVTAIAVGGVTVGVAALLLSLAIVRGFSGEITGKIISFGSHVQVQKYGGEPVDGADRIMAQIYQLDDVESVIPVIQEFALLRRSSRDIDGVLVSGIGAATEALEERLIEGDLLLHPDSSGRPAIVIGRQLARLLNTEVGETVTAYSVRSRNQPAPAFIGRPDVKQFYVAGVYETSFARYDEYYVYTDIASARALFDYAPDQVSRFDVYLDDVNESAAVAVAVDEKIGFPIVANTVFQIYRQYFAWVRLQQTITPVVISLIVLVAAFNIFGTLLMIMFEKTREIGILGSMGASPFTIFRLFLCLGLMIGGGGVVAGQLLALILALLQKEYAIIPLPAESYYMDVAPIDLNGIDFLIVGGVTLALCALTAIIPALIASYIKPINAIRVR